MPILIFTLLAVTSISVWYFWAKTQTYKGIIKQFVHRLSKAKILVDDKDREIGQQKSQFASLKKQSQANDQQFRKLQNQLLTKSADLIAEKKSTKTMTEKFESRVDHLQQQISALTKQLEEAIHSKQEIQQKSKKSSTDLESMAKLKKQFLENKETLNKTSKKLAQFQKDFKNIEPKVHFALKKRVSEYSRLYSGMRSLKEMSDDKNKNFETALIHLSKWTLGKIGATVPEPQHFGELVGEALEKTGGTFIHDDVASDDDQKVETIPVESQRIEKQPSENQSAENPKSTGE